MAGEIVVRYRSRLAYTVTADFRADNTCVRYRQQFEIPGRDVPVFDCMQTCPINTSPANVDGSKGEQFFSEPDCFNAFRLR